MSNGTIAELPPSNIPDELDPPDNSTVMLLLPHNKYLLGTKGCNWIYADTNNLTPPTTVSLYDSQALALENAGSQPTILHPNAVNALRQKLLAVSEPPGSHTHTVLMLRTIIPPSQSTELLDPLKDEQSFHKILANNPFNPLTKAYWTLRFALNRSEMETITRLKAWLKADPEIFSEYGETMRLWFSLLEEPDDEGMLELEELSFSRMELKRMMSQNASPVVVYNPSSGWLVLARFGRARETIFFVWAYYGHELWHELRERKKLTVNDIILASWGEYDTRQAMEERAKYKGAEDISL